MLLKCVLENTHCELKGLRVFLCVCHFSCPSSLNTIFNKHLLLVTPDEDVSPRRTRSSSPSTPGTKLRDDAIICEIVELSSKSVLAVTCYTPNFVDSAIALGKLSYKSLDRAYAVFESHYIHRPEKLWGTWSERISSLSTTKTISAIAATRYYEVLSKCWVSARNNLIAPSVRRMYD